MEEKIKEMKKKYAKIQRSIQRSEKAARAKSHVKRKLAEQANMQHPGGLTSPQSLSSLQGCDFTEKPNQTVESDRSKIAVSFSICHDVGVSQHDTDISLHSEGDKSDRNSRCSFVKPKHCMGYSDHLEAGSSSFHNVASKSNNLKNIKEIEMQTDGCEIKDIPLNPEGTVIEDSDQRQGYSEVLLRASQPRPEKSKRGVIQSSPSLPDLPEEFETSGDSGHTWTDGLLYPNEYYVRTTRSMNGKECSGKTSKLSQNNLNICTFSGKSSQSKFQGTVNMKNTLKENVETANSCCTVTECKCIAVPDTQLSYSEHSQSLLVLLSSSKCKENTEQMDNSRPNNSQYTKQSSTPLLDIPVHDEPHQNSSSLSTCTLHVSVNSSPVMKSYPNQTLPTQSLPDRPVLAVKGRARLGRSKLSRKKNRSCDNSPIDCKGLYKLKDISDDCVKGDQENELINAVMSLKCTQLDQLNQVTLRSQHENTAGNKEGECINCQSDNPVSTEVCMVWSICNDITDERNIFPRFPQTILQKSTTDFFLPDSQFVHLKVAKVKSTPVQLRTKSRVPSLKRSVLNSCLDLNHKPPKCAELDDEESPQYIGNVQSRTGSKDTIAEEIEHSDEDGGKGIALTNYFNYKIYTRPGCSAETGITDTSYGECDVSSTTVQERDCSNSVDLLCSEGSSVLESRACSNVKSNHSLTMKPEIDTASFSSEQYSTSSCLSNAYMSTEEEMDSSCKRQNADEELMVKKISEDSFVCQELEDEEETEENNQNFQKTTRSHSDDTVSGEDSIKEYVLSSSLKRETTPVDLLMKDLCEHGSNVTQESPFSGVATGSPPHPAAIPDAQALDNDAEEAVKLTGCLWHGLDDVVLCIDSLDCSQDETLCTILAVCFTKSLIIWSQTVNDEQWKLQTALNLTQVESFDDMCLLHVDQSVWLAVGGMFLAAPFRLFHLSENQNLQEHSMTSDSFISSEFGTMCGLTNDGIASVMHDYKRNKSTLFHISLNIDNSNVAPIVSEIGTYSGKIASVNKIHGTQSWIVGLSFEHIVLWDLKREQPVRCIDWDERCIQVPQCLQATTEGGLLFMVLGCPDKGPCRLAVANPATGRTTFIEYNVANGEEPSRFLKGAIDGQYVAGTFSDGSCNIWNICTGQKIVSMKHVHCQSTAVRFIKQGVLCVGINRCVHFYDCTFME